MGIGENGGQVTGVDRRRQRKDSRSVRFFRIKGVCSEEGGYALVALSCSCSRITDIIRWRLSGSICLSSSAFHALNSASSSGDIRFASRLFLAASCAYCRMKANSEGVNVRELFAEEEAAFAFAEGLETAADVVVFKDLFEFVSAISPLQFINGIWLNCQRIPMFHCTTVA